MHTLSPSFVLGYHGCDRDIGEKILAGKDFQVSKNDYDWLGQGIYFWESNPKRGLDYARELKSSKRSSPKITHPYVIGAIIDAGLCLDLTTSTGIELVATAHQDLTYILAKAGRSIPKNSADKLRRKLDCAVVNYCCEERDSSSARWIDTVRGVFIEGDPVYPDAGFYEKTHIQICVRNHNQIKGVFRVPQRFLT